MNVFGASGRRKPLALEDLLPNSGPPDLLAPLNTDSAPHLPDLVRPLTPLASTDLAARELKPLGPAPSAVTIGADYLFPDAPKAPTSLAAPVRDTGAEAKKQQVTALVSLLAGLAVGGVPGGLAAAGGALGGLRRRQDQAWAGRLGRHRTQQAEQELDYKRRRLEWEDETARLKLQKDADDDRVAGLRRERLDEAAATKAEGDAAHRLFTEREGVIKRLTDLTPAAQIQEINRLDHAGELGRLGLDIERNDEDGLPILNLTTTAQQNVVDGRIIAEQKATQARIDKQEQERRDLLRQQLRQEYGLLTNPRLSKVGAARVGKRITALETKLGLAPGGDGSEYAQLLDAFTPVQRAQMAQAARTHGLALQRFQEQKRQAGANEAYRDRVFKARQAWQKLTFEQRQATAKTQVEQRMKVEKAKPAALFHKNMTRLSAIERALHPGGSTNFTADERSALELERDMINAQQVQLVPMVPHLPKDTAKRFGPKPPPQPDGTAEGDTAYLHSLRASSSGRYDAPAAPAPSKPTVSKMTTQFRGKTVPVEVENPPEQGAWKTTKVSGQTFRYRIKKRGGGK